MRFAEYLSQQWRHLGRRISTDFDLFLPNYIEKAIEGFLSHVAVEIEILRDSTEHPAESHRARLIMAHQVVVLLRHVVLSHRSLHDRRKGVPELARGLALEVIGRRMAAAGYDSLSVAEAHARYRPSEDRFGLRSGGLRRPIHAQDELIELRTITDGAQARRHRPELLREQNLYRTVIKVAVALAGQIDSVGRARQQRLFEPRCGLAFA